MNLADLHDQAALASVSSDLLDKAASAGVEAMASVLADAMSWTSGDFLPCQSAALEDGARVIAGALARMAIENGLLPEEPSAVADPVPVDPAVLFNCCTDGAEPDCRMVRLRALWAGRSLAFGLAIITACRVSVSAGRRPQRFARGDPATDRAGCAPGLGDQLAFGLAVACAWSRRITSFPLGGLRPRSSLKATAKAA